MPRSVLTIGSFDGVHLGHRALIAKAREIAEPVRAKVIALAFDPHPLATINPEAAPARLSTWEDRQRLLQQAGADQVIKLEPCADTLGLSPEAFIERMIRDHAPIDFVEGPDFHFGCARSGDVALLAQLGDRLGFQTHIIDPVSTVLDDHSQVQVSSTLTRWLIKQARVRDAARLLGRPYRLVGQIVQGDRRGRTIGFPTANLRTDLLLPADGVYAGRAVLPNGRAFPAALNIGERPTFAGALRTVEAHLLLDRPSSEWVPLTGLPEYGWTLQVDLLAWLRDQARFAGIDALKAQLHRDCDRVRKIIANPGAPLPLELADVRSALTAGGIGATV